jgi:hypothetical protein
MLESQGSKLSLNIGPVPNSDGEHAPAGHAGLTIGADP